MVLRISIPLFFILITVKAVFSQDFDPDSDTIRLNEVVVKAYQVNTTLMRLPGSLSVVSGKEIHVQDGTNLANVLNRIPGIKMQSGT